jgi:hypothetical protein
LTFNDDFVRYLVDEIYPPGTLGARTPAAEKFYREAAAAHGENLELILRYQEILTTRWRNLKEGANEARRQGLIARADAVNAVLAETIRIVAGLNAQGYVTPRWQRAMYDAWISVFEPPDDDLFAAPIRVSA